MIGTRCGMAAGAGGHPCLVTRHRAADPLCASAGPRLSLISTPLTRIICLSSAQCDDLLHGRDVTDWHLPGAPYVFPDLIVLLPCQWLAPHLPAAFLAYCFMIHLSLAAVLPGSAALSGLRWPTATDAAGCGRLSSRRREPRRPTATAATACSSILAVTLRDPSSDFSLLALTVHSLRRGPSWFAIAAFLLIGGWGAFSDQLLVAQLLAPLALALLRTGRATNDFRPASGLPPIADGGYRSCFRWRSRAFSNGGDFTF